MSEDIKRTLSRFLVKMYSQRDKYIYKFIGFYYLHIPQYVVEYKYRKTTNHKMTFNKFRTFKVKVQ